VSRIKGIRESATGWRGERRQARNRGSWPISRVLSGAIIHLGRRSPGASRSLPAGSADRFDACLFGLAPGGVWRAVPVARGAVGSYPTISTLPVPDGSPRAGHRRFAFCSTFRRLATPRRYLAPCPVEPGLSSASRRRLPSQLRRQYKLRAVIGPCFYRSPRCPAGRGS
jgi:hypothetical protein